MVRKLIDWAVANPLVVMILMIAVALAGSYAFINVNIEAYPAPAPAIIEVVAQYPGASAEEVERQSPHRWKSRSPGCRDWKRPGSSHCLDWRTFAISSTPRATTRPSKTC